MNPLASTYFCTYSNSTVAYSSKDLTALIVAEVVDLSTNAMAEFEQAQIALSTYPGLTLGRKETPFRFLQRIRFVQ